jgi:hypothetical protein
VDFAVEEGKATGIQAKMMQQVPLDPEVTCLNSSFVDDGWEEDDAWDDELLDEGLPVAENPTTETATSENGWSDDKDLDFEELDPFTDETKVLSTTDNVVVSSSSLFPLQNDSPSPPPLVVPKPLNVMALYKAQLEASVNTWVANVLVADDDDAPSPSDYPNRAGWDPALEAYLSRARQARRQAGLL